MVREKVWNVPAVLVLLMLVGFVLPLAAGAGELEDALDNPVQIDGVTPLVFTTDLGLPWASDTTTFHTNGASVRSGAISDAPFSSLTTTVSGPASVLFYQKVSSHPTYDMLKFTLDNALRSTISGSVNWQQKNFTLLTAGTHTLRWTYIRYALTSAGSGTAWLDKVVVSPHTALKVTYPNGGEPLISGTTATIMWNAPASAEKYDLYYTTNNGTTWTKFASDITSTAFTNITHSSWTWPVPKSNMTACKVKVVAKNGAGVVVGTDVSDKSFAVNNVRLTAPNGKDVIEAGGTFDITWEATATASSFALSYSWDNGLTWKPITATPVSGVTATSWPVPVPTTGNKTACKVKIVAYNGAIVIGTDTSDATFTTQVLKVTSPNGEEHLNAKDNPTFPISFTVYGLTAASATISYTMDNGATWPLITKWTNTFTDGNTYTYGSWTVPAVTTVKSACKVKVVLKNKAGTVLATDTSDANFTIDPVFTLSGTVTRNGQGLWGATVNLSGDDTASVITDYYGKYYFPGLLKGTYTITPSYPGYVFTPPSVTRTVMTANISGLNFTSGLASDTTPPTAPAALLVTFESPTSTKVYLSWAASTDNVGVTGYKIYRNGVYHMSASSFWGTATTDVVPSLAGTYCYAVSAYDAAGNESAKCVEACGDRVPPSVPTILSATAVYPSQVDLLWTAATDTGSGVAGYNLYRDGVKVKSSITGTAGSNGGLAQGMHYCFTVTAFDKGSNESSQSTPVCATTPTWQYEFVTRSTNTASAQSMDNGECSAMATDSAGHQHAVYENNNTWPYLTVQYATNALGSWTTTTLVPNSMIPNLFLEGIVVSVATDTNDKVHLSYWASNTSTLYYMTNALGSWTTTTIQNGASENIRVGSCNSLLLDKNGKAHVSYCDGNGQVLMYATNALGSWVTTTVDTDPGYNISGASIAIDSQGYPHISYIGSTNSGEGIKYATNASGDWATTTVNGDVSCDGTSIGVDSAGKVHIVHHDWFFGVLHYITNATGQWIDTRLDAPANYVNAGSDLMLRIDRNDKVHIVYQERNAYDYVSPQYSTLKHATNASGEWYAVYVVKPVVYMNLGYTNTLSFDPDNKLHISTYDAYELGMKHWFY